MSRPRTTTTKEIGATEITNSPPMRTSSQTKPQNERTTIPLDQTLDNDNVIRLCGGGAYLDSMTEDEKVAHARRTETLDKIVGLTAYCTISLLALIGGINSAH